MAGLRERKKERTVEALSAALLAALEQKEWAEVRLEDLIHPASLSKQTFYNFFPDREALLGSIVDRRLKRWAKNTAVYHEWNVTTAERLVFMFKVLAREVRREKRFWRAVGGSREGFPSRPLREVNDNLRGILAEGQRRGEISPRFKADRLAEYLNLVQFTICLNWAQDRPRPHSLAHRQKESLEIFFAPILTVPSDSR